MLDFVQQLVSGVALGCVYGLIALGFVLVYKATEVVNFAQGDLMMLGGFFAFTFIVMMGLNYWIGFAGAVAAMALLLPKARLAGRAIGWRCALIGGQPFCARQGLPENSYILASAPAFDASSVPPPRISASRCAQRRRW